jgi:TonB family protein
VGVQGMVTLQVSIGKDGHVTQVSLISGHPLLARAAMDAVKQYVYEPVKGPSGEAVNAEFPVDVPLSASPSAN